VDFELSDDQRAVIEAVDALLARHAGPARAIELTAKGAYDESLDTALGEAGFGEIALGAETGALEAALVAERVARSAGTVAFAATALVAPLVCSRALPGPVALARADEEGPIRFAPAARTLLVLDGDRARVGSLSAADVTPVRSNFGYPVGRVSEAARDRGEPLARGSGERLLAWWRVALAIEALGAMDAALRFTVRYLTQREQFGRPIGSFQAVQHRLADCAVQIEGARWLSYEAAAQGAPQEAAACAAAFALGVAGRVHRETHQLSGAIGYTTEHDLHVWSLRLLALRLELGGEGAQLRALARERWGAPA
jgi:alkylation response protein AidB-like acyl-CoA dehydrogenase